MPRPRTHGRVGERWLAGPQRYLFLPAWCVYRPLVGFRNLAYDRRWLPRRVLSAPVISVGNLALGGTGKTPLVETVVGLCRDLGRSPWVLSRGYRAPSGAVANDEAATLSCPAVCDPDRWRGGRRALAEGADCLVLDDGFQHRRLHRDLDLVCIDATRPGVAGPGGRVFPLGFLREPAAGLRRSHAVVITRSDQVAPEALAALRRDLGAWDRPVYLSRHRPAALTPLAGGEDLSPAVLRGRPVWLVSGIGRPGTFEDTVRALGADIRGRERFPDHHRFRRREMAAVTARARRHGADLVVTAKDAVKLIGVLPASTTCLVLRVRLVLDDGPGFRRLLAGVLGGAASVRGS